LWSAAAVEAAEVMRQAVVVLVDIEQIFLKVLVAGEVPKQHIQLQLVHIL
jgi:hypothetical protein